MEKHQRHNSVNKGKLLRCSKRGDKLNAGFVAVIPSLVYDPQRLLLPTRTEEDIKS